MKRIIKEFKDALTTKTGTSAYDTTATVIRVQGSTLWVHIPGGVDETPVKKTVDAKEGDTIQVRVGGGSAWATGNASAPPTDDTTAVQAHEVATDAKQKATDAEDKASNAENAAEIADGKAEIALQSANGKNKVYYSATEPTAPAEGFSVGDTWFDTANDYQINEWDGSDWVPFQLGEDAIADLAITNAKIANATIQSAKIAGLDVGKLTGGYIAAGHIDTLSLSVGNNRTLGDELDDLNDEIDDVYPYMTYIDSTYGVRVYRGDRSDATNAKYYSQMNAGGFDVVANNVTLAHLGFDTGKNAGGSVSQEKYPYFTFGKRASDTASTRGNYSVAEGNSTTASGWCSHAEGLETTASGYGSHAEGYLTASIAQCSHSEGDNTSARGINSHAEGRDTQAVGYQSHAGGFDTIANYDNQTVIGRHNNNNSNNALEIGNGSTTSRSNAFAVDWDGVARLAGNLFTGCNADSTGGYEFGRKASDHIVVAGIHICWGIETITHTGSGYKEVQVTLPYTYTSAPKCFASYGNRLLSGAPRTAYATQSDLAGNKIYVASYATAACTAYVNWMTIGV